MYRITKLVLLLGMLAAPAAVAAQEPARVTGRVTSESGAPVASASVFIPALNVGTITRADGTFALSVPASMLAGARDLEITAQILGYRSQTSSVALTGGQTATVNFQLSTDVLQLEGIVATGIGQTTTRERLGVAIASVKGEDLVRVPTPNVVNALAAKAPGVEIASSSGEPGASSHIRIRGVNTIVGDGQPLFVIDGVPINNQENVQPSTVRSTGGTSENPVGLAGPIISNRAIDVNPNDIASIEILKGAAAAAIYGARAANGVVLITTKSGQAGQTRASLTVTASLDRVNDEIPLQRSWHQGVNGVSDNSNLRSWGSQLQAGQSYDHWGELFETGRILDSNLTLSGGTERTSYFLSVGWLDHDGVIVQNNDFFQRTSARLKGSHQLRDNLTVTGNVAYAQTKGGYTQKGSNVSGLLLGGTRTPPSFNNCIPGSCYQTAEGFQRTYTNPEPEGITDTGFFDNPFFVINENLSTSNVSRTFGNITVDYLPVDWLQLAYALGNDYSNDERLDVQPLGNVTWATGYLGEGRYRFQSIDHSLTATGNRQLSSSLAGSLTMGWNRNSRNFDRFYVEGFDFVAPNTYTLDNTTTRIPDNYEYKIHAESFFGQAQVDLSGQLFLTGAIRNDGYSTFGQSERRHWYPKASAAWDFTRTLNLANSPLSFGKLRAAWGQAGNEPPVYGTIGGYTAADLADAGWTSILRTTYAGRGGLATSVNKAQPDLKPERTTEVEVGLDASFFSDRAGLGVTFYNARTEDAILRAPLANSTGFFQQLQNAATIRNRGWEVNLDVRPVQKSSFSWDIGVNWARNDNRVLDLGDESREFITMPGGFASATGAAVKGERIGVLRGADFARCGRGLVISGIDIDQECGANAPAGALYVGANGFPILDGTVRVIGDPHPDWTAGIRNTFTIAPALQLSALVDIRKGGEMWNGTTGALYSYGTHADTEQRASCSVVSGALTCTGNEKVFGRDILAGPVAGPGANTAVPIGENWYRAGLGSSFGGVNSQFIEDAGFVKLREVAVTYTLPNTFASSLGMSAVNVRVAGRNLVTWTDYTGQDPETNVAGAINLRGVDYFNNPQTRTWLFSVSLNR
jgi:TonB-linked SusC/RagA family outer membrane protein